MKYIGIAGLYVIGFIWFIILNLLSVLWHFNFRHLVSLKEVIDHTP